jgi:hypothetical protein
MGRMTVLEARRALAHLATYGTPPNRETAKRLSVGLEQTLAQLDSEVFPFLKGGGSDIQFIYGPNGRGKTHYLLAVEEMARENNFVTARVDCSHGTSPFESLRETYERIAVTMCADRTRDSEQGLPAVIATALERDQTALGLALLVQGLQASRHLAAEVRNLAIAYASTLASHGAVDHLSTKLEALLLGSSSASVQLGPLYRAHRELRRPLGKITRRNAAHWMRSLLSLPTALGYSGFVLMFDETEVRDGKVQRNAISLQMANLRNLVDYCALGALSGCLIIYAAADDFLDLAKQHLDALAQRIEPPSLLGGRNPSSLRAAWADLDDLTAPRPEDPAFFWTIAERLGDLAAAAGVPDEALISVKAKAKAEAERYARSPQAGVVREFVKRTASQYNQTR